jgi:hypothetical protein
MFCNHCGATVNAEQLVCTQCGRSPVANRAGFVARSRVPEHLHLLAIFWIVMGCLLFVPVPIMAVIATVARNVLANIAGNMQAEGVPAIFNLAAPLVFLTIAFFIGIIAITTFVTGWGLLKVRPWGRILAIVMAFLALLHPPFGTALGIYTLYVLLPSDAGAEYERMAAATEQNAVVQPRTA